MQPDENSQRAQFYRTGRDEIEAKNTAEMYCRSICAPYHSPGSDQASQTLFRGNAEKRFLALAFLDRLSYGRVHRLLRQVKIAFATAVPADIVNLRVFFHSVYNVTKTVFSARY
jgi:hypothetical protein